MKTIGYLLNGVGGIIIGYYAGWHGIIGGVLIAVGIIMYLSYDSHAL